MKANITNEIMDKSHAFHNEKLTPYLRELIAANNNDIRLNKQFIYDDRELLELEGEFDDVASDASINVVNCLYHRYPSKVLLFPTENCLCHCRFCFRKFIRGTKAISENDLLSVYGYLKGDPNINEVILSGGDPMVLSPDRIIRIISELKNIKTVKIIRIHTRALTFDPDLLTDEFIENLVKFRPLSFVFHINSHLELTDIAKSRVEKIITSGIQCYSQTALLKEINDSFNDLSKLFSELFYAGIKPYYLFHPDKVKGTSHFYVPLKKGIEIYNSLYNNISGLAMPIYLFNIPGGYGHSIVDLGNIVQIEDNKYKIKTWKGDIITYEE
jgi:lysine 2,3-aminomutase